MMVTDSPEYQAGWAWATEHGPLLAELFSGKEVSTPELRVRLFREATRRWPSDPDDLMNDLKQVAFVMGALKAAIKTLGNNREAVIAANEAGLEMSQLWSTEQGKARALEDLKKKPENWWRTRMGAATPNQVVNALSFAWRVDWAREKGRKNPRSKWEILIDTLGPREMEILADATAILERKDGYERFVIDAPEDAFEIISRPAYEGGRMLRYPGEIVG
jgi:hypothetical protein